MKINKNVRLVLVVVVSVLVAKAVANYDRLLPHSWQNYKAPDGSFSIDFPSKPESTQSQISGAERPIVIQTITAEPTKSTVYAASYFDRDNSQQDSPQTILEGARDGSLTKVQGTLISQTSLTVDGYPALDLQAHARGKSLMNARLILVNNRLFLLMAVTTVEGDQEPKTIRRMFDSFKILQKS